MSAGGVMPERGPGVVGRMEDADGVPVALSVSQDGTVRIVINDGWYTDLDHDAREEFQRLFMEAERRAEAMDTQTPF